MSDAKNAASAAYAKIPFEPKELRAEHVLYTKVDQFVGAIEAFDFVGDVEVVVEDLVEQVFTVKYEVRKIPEAEGLVKAEFDKYVK